MMAAMSASEKNEAGRKLHFLTSLLLVLNYYKDNMENNHKASV